jgi:hypothetical protein
MTYYVLTFMRVAYRQVCIAGITTSPDAAWMDQTARNVSYTQVGFLCGCRYLLHDRDAKFCASFDLILESVGSSRCGCHPEARTSMPIVNGGSAR